MPENPMPENTELDIVYALAGVQGTDLRFAARKSGLYRSDDGGQSWRMTYQNLDVDLEGPFPTTSVVVSPGFAGEHRDTHDPTVVAGVAGGVLRSTDGGESWHVAGFGTPPPMVSSLVISPDFLHDGVLLAGTMEDGVFRSADRGVHWAAWNFGLLDLNVFCLAISPAFAEDEALFAGVESGIFRSTNGGRAWREVTLPIGFEAVLTLAISPDFARDGVAFAGTESQGLLRSTDGGKTWRQLGQDVIDGPVNGLRLSPTYGETPRLLLVLDTALWRSEDGGDTWAPVPVDAELAARGLTTVLAPEGLAPGASVLVGTASGDVATLTL